MNTFGTVLAMIFVVAVLLWAAYALIRPFTHTDHDHRDIYHPPRLED